MPDTLSIRGVAHDLNNQIMIVLNSLDRLLVLHPEDEDAWLAVKAAEQCVQLTARLLPQSRPARSPNAAAPTIREALVEAAQFVRALLPAHNRLDLDVRSDAHVPEDAPALQQAVVNLCLNAIDAMDGPGHIRVAADDEPGAVTITVSDTGPGVPAELESRIFEPFFTTRAARGGNGLGLVRVRETVERLGGEITLHPVFPHGALFRIHLPLSAPIADSPGRQAA